MATDAKPEPTIEELAAQEAAAAVETPPADPPVDPPADPPSDPPAEDAPANEHIAWLEEKTGFKFSDRYDTDDAAGQGVKHAFQLIGQRNEDAAEYRALKEKLSPDQIAKIKAGESLTPTTPLPQADKNLPTTHREYKDLVEKAARMQQEAIPGFQDDPEYRRAIAAQEVWGERAFQAPEDIAALKAQVEELQKGLVNQQQYAVDTAANQEIEAWRAQHAQELFQDNGKPTALGSLAASILETDPLCGVKSGLSQSDRFEVALRTAKGQLPPSGGTKTPGKNATQQPGARATPKKTTYEELLKQMPDNEAKALELFNEQCLAEDKAQE